ncbi:V-type ATP synthase subunit I [Candidatus Bathyarchaeota archaeon]|nr:V-type ATP synthase subunit I [Candidatus Bathyarchaeota archaeon]
MFRPERVSETSIICLKKDVDQALEILSDFGEFHIEKVGEKSKPERYEQLIRQMEEIIRNLTSLTSQLKIERTGLLDIFKAEEETRVEITVENWQSLVKSVEKEASNLKREADSILASIRNLDSKLSELQHLQHIFALLSQFKIDLEALEELHFIYTVVATVPSRHIPELEKAMANYPSIFYHRPITKHKEFIFIASPSKYEEEIEKVIKTHHAEAFQIPHEMPKKSAEALKRVNLRLEKTIQKKNEALKSLEEFTKKNKLRILALKETTQNILIMLKAKQSSLETEQLTVIKGYVPERELNKLKREMYEKLEKRVLVIEKRLTPSEDPPTLVKNPSFIKPFEMITKLYGTPHYDELDPTPLIAITFPLIFGLMFGDLGHGLILLIIGTSLGLLIKRNEGLRNFAWILAACGIGAIFAGLLFGEFFGKHIFPPLWFSPFEDVTKFLILSIFIGIIQILSGFIIDFINFILKGEVIDAFATSLPKLLFYVGSIYLIINYQLNFGAWLEGPILFPLIPFIFLIFGKPIIRKILKFLNRPIAHSEEHYSLLERFFESSDLVTRLLSNTMSYARILALLMAHWALLLVTYTIADMVASTPTLGTAISYLIIVGGNIFVIGFEGLIVFIHTLRLHFYEWFSKFYQGTGIEFSPFRQNFKYTKIIFKR